VRRRWPVLLLLASGLTFLASLYLPWQRVEIPTSASAREVGILESFAKVDGWGRYGFGFGYAAALFALALVVACGVALLRPLRLPLVRCGMLVGYGAVAVAVDTWYERRFGAAVVHTPPRFHFAYGAYLGVAAGAAAMLGVAGLRRRFPAGSLLVGATGLALLITLALPWADTAPIRVSLPGYFGTAAAAAVVAVVFVPAAAVLFCGGVIVELAATTDLAYGAWTGLGVAALLSAVTVRRARAVDLALLVPGALFVATLYFHWQAWIVGWSMLGTAAAVTALAIVLWPASRLEFAVGFALLVATQGFELTRFTPPGYHLRLAAELGFACAALLFAVVLYRSRALPPPKDRVALRVCAVLAVVAYVVVTLVPIWHGISFDWTGKLAFIAPSWLGLAGIVLAVRLAGAWVRPRVEAGLALLIPLVMLALIALWLIEQRSYNVDWGGRIVVALLLLLALLGWLEQRGRLENFRVPDLLRVDRL
jgi:hypothetical protein